MDGTKLGVFLILVNSAFPGNLQPCIWASRG